MRIDRDLLDEVDRPTLRHGLQDMNGRRLVLPTRQVDWPLRESLEQRFRAFAA